MLASSPFGLVRDMLATPEIVAAFDPSPAQLLAAKIQPVGRLLFTGEGSSRIFPSKHALRRARAHGDRLIAASEAGLQSREYALQDWAVLALSNSGKTSEVVQLFGDLSAAGHPHRYSLTAAANSKLESLATAGWVLQCGAEAAVAATKSVLEQALFCQAVIDAAAGRKLHREQLANLGQAMRTVLTAELPASIVDPAVRAGTIYFAGPNDGVAEELTLKTNEITRKKSDYLEGTYAVHGIEEVMDKSDLVVWIDPPAECEQKFYDVLVKGVGLTIVAIAARPTRFPTIQIPAGEFPAYLQMAAGWNLLVAIGTALGVNLDKPVRARKVGNEFVG